LAGGMVISSFSFMSMYMVLIRPEKVLFGLETKSEFLQRIIRDYSGINFADKNLTDDERMMFLWDGRGYYCERACVPDVDQSGWTAITGNNPNIQAVTNRLKSQEITHLFLSIEDISFFLLKHDLDGVNRRAVDFLIKEFVPKCTELIYKDDWSRIYRINYDSLICR
jgi:hypothetical protein